MAVLRITYTLVEGPWIESMTSTEHDIGDESWRVIPAVRRAVEEIVAKTREPEDA